MTAPLPPEDLERLRFACGRRTVDPTRSLYGPDSVTWRVNREAVVLLGGGRALLLQVAHPLVAAGVAAHSRFRTHPLERLRQTLDLVLTLVFADAAAAIGAVRAIERVHARVQGVLGADVGPFARGTPYDARDPALLFWVHATLVETALLVYERFVTPLPPGARAAYYEESKIAARLFGIPEATIPPGLADFQDYMRATIRSGVLAVGVEGREIAAAILRPPLPPGLRALARATNLFTIGLLPAAVRERYGLAWGTLGEGALTIVESGTRSLVPWLPGWIRLFPHARRARPG